MSVRRVYETTFIINAALEDNDVESVIQKVSSYIENHGGIIKEVNKWGRRRLAYAINKKYNGFYAHIVFEATSNTVPILERFLVLEDTILRHLTIVLPRKLADYRVKRAIERGISIHDTLSGKIPEKVVEKEVIIEPVLNDDLEIEPVINVV
ncbi:MAG: 30S ribosomal protein S6 [Ignavibacteria bacterium GWB2_35_12]|nr:MAG: 30S ribosomal protein S6 [Ignavibacteria bacterium GWB2_35_12]OGU91441.1 MAG: 30S ribosomal protein S6 [Ignavibacteria bacterium RIFOXYA2_FULL_35_10]OGV22227.1 MAG: 30S ribosomal protein S6 [Ignavibacteria bacterium RIFOXYC2_FULL_35_21]